jgi:preprotein translocase subunit YajC
VPRVPSSPDRSAPRAPTQQAPKNPMPTLLAQDGPGLAGTPATPASPSSTPTGATPPAGGGLDTMTLLIFGVLLALIVSSLLGGRKEKKRYEQMLASIKKHDQVRTAGGIIGSVVEVKDTVVVLKVDEGSNTKISVARNKIEAVLKESAAT